MKKIETGAITPSVQPIRIQLGEPSLLVFVWIATLLVSSLPNIISQEFQIFPSFPILWIRIILLVVFIALSFVWKVAQPLRTYFVIFLVLYLVDALFNWIGGTSIWQSWFEGAVTSFSKEMLSSQLLRLGAALLLTAALFGLWHYYGVPYGVVGVIMAGGLGWLLGKSMLETRGLFWAWFIHFCQDVVIFTFIAAGSIIPGG